MSKFDPYEHLKISLNPDGSVSRYYHVQTVEANPSPGQGEATASKDVVINQEKKTWARLFRPTRIPSNDKRVARLPIVMFFHSGGWVCHSASDKFYHDKCAYFASEIPAVIISVNYRLAPEHRLPAQYDDAVDAIMWVREQLSSPAAGAEEWLRDYADFSRCYLMGRQNGANIAFNAALRTLDTNLSPLRIAGLVLNQPMFGGKKRTASELKYATDELLPLPVLDLMWELALPKGTDRDHRYCNPMADVVQQQKLRRIGRCLVIGYGEDPMVDRQQELVTTLVACGAKVEAHFDDIGFHGIDLVDKKRATFNVRLVKEFI